MMPRNKLWTDHERDILVRHYPLHGADWSGWDELLPGRSRQSLQIMASRMMVSYSTGNNWNEDDEVKIGMVISRLAHVLGRDYDEVMSHISYMHRRDIYKRARRRKKTET